MNALRLSIPEALAALRAVHDPSEDDLLALLVDPFLEAIGIEGERIRIEWPLGGRATVDVLVTDGSGGARFFIEAKEPGHALHGVRERDQIRKRLAARVAPYGLLLNDRETLVFESEAGEGAGPRSRHQWESIAEVRLLADRLAGMPDRFEGRVALRRLSTAEYASSCRATCGVAAAASEKELGRRWLHPLLLGAGYAPGMVRFEQRIGSRFLDVVLMDDGDPTFALELKSPGVSLTGRAEEQLRDQLLSHPGIVRGALTDGLRLRAFRNVPDEERIELLGEFTLGEQDGVESFLDLFGPASARRDRNGRRIEEIYGHPERRERTKALLASLRTDKGTERFWSRGRGDRDRFLDILAGSGTPEERESRLTLLQRLEALVERYPLRFAMGKGREMRVLLHLRGGGEPVQIGWLSDLRASFYGDPMRKGIPREWMEELRAKHSSKNVRTGAEASTYEDALLGLLEHCRTGGLLAPESQAIP